MAGKTAILSIRILADAKNAQEGLDKTSKSTGKFASGIESAAVPATAALAGLAAGAYSAASAAAEDEQSAALLAKALKNTTGATDDQVASVEEWISGQSKAAAVADDELRPALSTLVRATGDVSTAQDAMGLALDISAATGKDLESVSTALAKGYGGQTAGLKKLVPGIDAAVVASGDMDAISAELAKTVGGSAAEAAQTSAGQFENMKIQMGEAQEAIGAALLPALAKMAKMLQGGAEWIAENSRLVLILGGVIGGFAAAILIANVALKAYAAAQKVITVATKAWAAVQWLLNAAMTANPIGLIIAGVVAFIAVIVLLWNKCDGFREFILKMWDAIKKATDAVWKAIQSVVASVWNAVKAIVRGVVNAITVYIRTYLAIVRTVFNTIKAVVTGVWNAIKASAKAVWDWIGDKIRWLRDVVRSVFSTIKSIVTGVWSAIRDAARSVFDWIADKIRWLRDTFRTVFDTIKSIVTGVFDKIKSVATTALDAILHPIDTIKRAFENVVSAIKSVIDWLGRIKIPSALKSAASLIDKINPFKSTADGGSSPIPTPGPTARLSAVPTFSGSSSASDSGVTININGALDPVAVAKQIRRILVDDDRRRSGVYIARPAR